jgi:hypothetical protein
MDLRSHNPVVRAFSRIKQGLQYLVPPRANEIDAELCRLLTNAEFELIRRCSLPDRAHLLAVHHRLEQSGCADRDVFKAGLLHDAGKADADVRINLAHRSTAVLVRAISPALLGRLAAPGERQWRRAFYLIELHSTLGAALARSAGCNERVCWLIEHHHDACARDDLGLLVLQRADEGRIG